MAEETQSLETGATEVDEISDEALISAYEEAEGKKEIPSKPATTTTETLPIQISTETKPPEATETPAGQVKEEAELDNQATNTPLGRKFKEYREQTTQQINTLTNMVSELVTALKTTHQVTPPKSEEVPPLIEMPTTTEEWIQVISHPSIKPKLQEILLAGTPIEQMKASQQYQQNYWNTLNRELSVLQEDEPELVEQIKDLMTKDGSPFNKTHSDHKDAVGDCNKNFQRALRHLYASKTPATPKPNGKGGASVPIGVAGSTSTIKPIKVTLPSDLDQQSKDLISYLRKSGESEENIQKMLSL